MDLNRPIADKIYRYLLKQGCTVAGAFGIIGNLYAESHLEPTNLENMYNSRFGMTDAQYTQGVDDGSYTNFVKDCAGYGLAQWTYWSRKQALLDYVQSKKVSIGDLDAQLEYLVKELKTNYRSVWQTVITSKDLFECTKCVMLDFERPANQSESAQKGRYSLAKQICIEICPKALNGANNSVKMAVWTGIKTFTKGDRVQISNNFVSTEFDCHGQGCCTETPIDYNLVTILQAVRNHFRVPVTVNCGYRCPKHNAEISGASKTSQHMSGNAGDIVVKGVHPVSVARYVETISGYHGMIGCYTWDNSGKGFVHIDTRGTDYRGIYTEDNAHCDYVKSFSENIARDSHGRLVIVVQRFLLAEGLYHGGIDGYCGEMTEQAITEWNAKHGRKNDSIWGNKCWNEAFPF